MLLELIGHTRVLFFGGKGGVGKTTVASTAALALAAAGRRVLLISTDPAHNLGHLFETHIGDTPTFLAPGLDAVELDPSATTNEHLKQVGETMRAMMPEHLRGEIHKHLTLAAGSPGTHEAALLERIATLVTEEAEYDHLIFDTAPSGHTSRLMALPELMAAWTDGLLERRAKSEHLSAVVRGLSPSGRDKVVTREDPVDRRNQELRTILLKRRTRFEQLRAILTDPQQCRFFLVLTAERMPLLESGEFAQELQAAGISVGGAIINRRSPHDQGEFLAQRHAREEQVLQEFPLTIDAPILHLPLLAQEISGLAQVQEFAAQL